MCYEIEIRFDSGTVTGDDWTAPGLAELGRLLTAKAEGRDDEVIGLQGGRTRTVGDIRSIRIEAQF